MFLITDLEVPAGSPRALAVLADGADTAVVCRYSPDDGDWHAVGGLKLGRGEEGLRPLPPCFGEALVVELCREYVNSTPVQPGDPGEEE
jgi:hypothetical protein